MKPVRHLPATVLSLTFPFAASLLAAGALEIKVTENQHADLVRDGIVLARFMTAHDTSTPSRRTETFKPYLHVFDPSGVVCLTKGPGGVFPHHRGLFVGFNKIRSEGKSYDRWHMTGGDQITRKLLATAAGGATAEIVADIEWQGQAGAPLLVEERRLTFFVPQKPFYFGIELRTSMKPVKGEVEMDGDPEHAGVQFRPSEKIAPKQTTYLFPGENVDAHKARDLAWAAEIITVEGKTFTVAVLNHPDNPKGTVFSAYRDYGRFGAFAKGIAKPEAPFTLRYQWLVAEGEVRDVTAIQQAWNIFTAKDQPTPPLTIRPADGAAKPSLTPKK